MARTKVVINRKAWGANVMAGAAVAGHIEALAEQVASNLPRGEVETFAAAVRGGGSRTRSRISGGNSSREEADSNDLISALSAVLPLART